MARSPCCDETGLKKGPWTPEEDQKLVAYIKKHGHGSWRALPKLAGLNRCGKSCRLRWTNYLRPDIKRGKFSPEEEQKILSLHAILGNKWSAIATHLHGRTDNEIKNFWNTHLKKKLIQMGFDPMTHQPRIDIFSGLPHLIALASLKELMEHHPWEEQAVKLQAELAKLQHLQYLLFQAQSSLPICTEMDTLHFMDSISSLKDNPPFNNSTNLLEIQNPQTLPPLGAGFSHLPGLESPLDNIKEVVQSNSKFLVLSQGDNSPTSPWLPSSLSPSPRLLPAASARMLNEAMATNPEEGCSNSSCGGWNNIASFWPDQLLVDDPMFHEIAN
ncbi:hypothetical protein Nepgr_026550 [Nepenthes gracilis]|uniref:Uncharacterized protein n=1 Tax=Nepenthes gracilis TaxID=150966 RepID=A0AAD3T9X7_NEPGR|nr:hypothetical protein Nepgr_026550 [Nepenthes gracilis]